MNTVTPNSFIVPLTLQWMNFPSDLQANVIFQAILAELTIFGWELYYAQQSSYGVGPRTDGCFGGDVDEIAEHCVDDIWILGGEDVTASATESGGNTYVWTHFKVPGSNVQRHIHIMVEPGENSPVQVRWI